MQNSNPWSVLVAPLAVLCFLRRKQATGGWLLWFLAQILLGAAAVVVNAAAGFHHYLPHTWTDPRLHLFYVLSRPPQALALVVAGWCACRAAVHHTTGQLAGLKAALLAAASAGGAVCAVDAAWFPSLQFYDARLCCATVVVLLYLQISVRVERVFVKHTWPAVAGNSILIPAIPRSDD